MTELRVADLTDDRGIPWTATVFTDPDADRGDEFLKVRLEPVLPGDPFEKDLPVTFGFASFLLALAPPGFDASKLPGV